jgi:hypothetical protein
MRVLHFTYNVLQHCHELNEQSSLEFVRLCECDDSDDPERVFDCVTINSSLSVSVKSE